MGMLVVGGSWYIGDLWLTVVLRFLFLIKPEDFGLHLLQLDVVVAGFIPFQSELVLLQPFLLLVDLGFVLEDFVFHLLIPPPQSCNDCLQCSEVRNLLD